MKDENFVYRNVYTSGTMSTVAYSPGSMLDNYTLRQKEENRGAKVAYRVRIRFKDGRNIGGPRGSVVWPSGAVRPALPPLRESLMKAIGAFAMLILVIAFACWFVFEVFL